MVSADFSLGQLIEDKYGNVKWIVALIEDNKVFENLISHRFTFMLSDKRYKAT